MMILSLPETSANSILLRRARRLRKITRKNNLLSQSEINQARMNPSNVAYEALTKPWQINALDPAVIRASFSVYEVEIFKQLTESFRPLQRLTRLSYMDFLFFLRIIPANISRNVRFQPRRIKSPISLGRRRTLYFACHPTAVTTTMWSNPK